MNTQYSRPAGSGRSAAGRRQQIRKAEVRKAKAGSAIICWLDKLDIIGNPETEQVLEFMQFEDEGVDSLQCRKAQAAMQAKIMKPGPQNGNFAPVQPSKFIPKRFSKEQSSRSKTTKDGRWDKKRGNN